MDTALKGNAKRMLRILQQLKEEGTEPVLILWALTRELRSLAAQAQALSQGMSQEKVWQEFRVFEKRKPLVRTALQRHTIQQIQQLLQQAALIDRIIKGLDAGTLWDALRKLVLAIGGIKL